MRYEDQLRSHPAYRKAAISAIEIYMRLYDDPSLTTETFSTSAAQSAELPLTCCSRRRGSRAEEGCEESSKGRAKGEEGSVAQLDPGVSKQSYAYPAAQTASDGKKEDQPVADEDPTGETLLKTETPLEDASKIWLSLERLASRRVEVWTSGYEIHIRQSESSYLKQCTDWQNRM